VNYLLDTHTLLWTLVNPSEIPKRTLDIIVDPRNTIVVSSVSLWEISIKVSLGKLILNSFEIGSLIENCKSQDFELINLEPEEAIKSSKLERFENHKDPFDRMMIQQCISRNLVFISKDVRLKQYKSSGLVYIWS
jgi:PIN domain nuclease of toxin-antitoxin system